MTMFIFSAIIMISCSHRTKFCNWIYLFKIYSCCNNSYSYFFFLNRRNSIYWILILILTILIFSDNRQFLVPARFVDAGSSPGSSEEAPVLLTNSNKKDSWRCQSRFFVTLSGTRECILNGDPWRKIFKLDVYSRSNLCHLINKWPHFFGQPLIYSTLTLGKTNWMGLLDFLNANLWQKK